MAEMGTVMDLIHPKTGEVRLPNGSFRVPSLAHAGQRSRFRYHPSRDGRAVLVTKDGREIELQPFTRKPLSEVHTRVEKRGIGQLQKLVDLWQGKERPNAQPGFGLPEVFRELRDLLGHLPPQDDREARTILGFYRKFGPLHPDHFRDALAKTRAALGPGRALETYLDHLARLIAAHTPPEKES